jgi:hypothetical protein
MSLHRRTGLACLLTMAIVAVGASSSQARPVVGMSAAVVYRVQVDKFDTTQPDGSHADMYRVLVYNPGGAKSVWFKVWALRNGKRILPTVISHDAGTKLIDRRHGKWRTRIKLGYEKEVTFAAKSAGADTYCAAGQQGSVCSDDPSHEGGTI